MRGRRGKYKTCKGGKHGTDHHKSAPRRRLRHPLTSASRVLTSDQLGSMYKPGGKSSTLTGALAGAQGH